MDSDQNNSQLGVKVPSLEEQCQMTVPQKMDLMFALTEAHHQRIRDELSAKYPGASKEELRRRYIARILPREDVIGAYKFDPVVEGFDGYTPA